MEKSETTDNPLRLVNPQQNVFYFDEIVIRSDFDNGNIARAERVDKRNVTNFIIFIYYSFTFGSLQTAHLTRRMAATPPGFTSECKECHTMKLSHSHFATSTTRYEVF